MMLFLKIILFTAIIYIFIIVGLRLLGKKELGQLSVADLVFIMLISEVVGDVMRASNDSLAAGLVAAITLMLINKGIKLFSYRSKKFSRFLEGTPSVLIRHGKLNRKEMENNKLTIEDIEQAGREQGIGDITTIALAILEVDGKISILKDADIKTETPL